jgi:hypothetical protein
LARPDSVHTHALKQFRQKLVDARREAVVGDNLDGAIERFMHLQQAIDLVDEALEDEFDLTPLPAVDDPAADIDHPAADVPKLAG